MAVTGGQKPHDERLIGLDILRGIASIAVVAFHYTIWYQVRYGHPRPLSPPIWFFAYAVELFFMISGFVILMSLERARCVSDFAVSRLVRVMPTFWLCVVITTIFVRWLGMPDGSRGPSMGSIGLNLLLVWPMPMKDLVDGVYWTLWCEAFFYIALGTVVGLGLKRYALAIFSGLVVIGVVDRTTGVFGGLPLREEVQSGLNLQFNHLMLLGMTLYRARQDGWKWYHGAIVLLCLSAAFSVRGPEAPFIIAGLFALMFGAIQARLTAKPFALLLFFGTISYPLYLLHQHIGYALISTLYRSRMSSLAALSIAAGIVLALATVVTFTFERPTYRLLRRWWKNRSRGPGSVPPVPMPQVVAAAERPLTTVV